MWAPTITRYFLERVFAWEYCESVHDWRGSLVQISIVLMTQGLCIDHTDFSTAWEMSIIV